MTTSPASISPNAPRYLSEISSLLKDLKERARHFPLTVDNYCATNVLSASMTFLTTFNEECLGVKSLRDVENLYRLLHDAYLEDHMHSTFVYADPFFYLVKMVGNYVAALARNIARPRDVSGLTELKRIVESEAFTHLLETTTLFSSIPPLRGHPLFYTSIRQRIK